MLSTLFKPLFQKPAKRGENPSIGITSPIGVEKTLTRYAFPWATVPTYRTVATYDPVPSLKADYQQFGVVKLKGLLSEEEAAHYLAAIQAITELDDTAYERIIAGDEKAYVSAGTVTRQQALWPLLAHPRLLACAHSLIGSTPKYIGRDSVFVHNSSKGFHRDSDVYNEGFRWGLGDNYVANDLTDHTLLRVMFYFNSPGQPINRLGFIPFSHQHPQPLPPNGWEEPIDALDHFPIWIPIEPGDAVVFDPRLRHSGENLFGPKYSLVMTYGADSAYNQHNAMESRACGDFLGYNDFTPELLAHLDEHNLTLTGFNDEATFQQYMLKYDNARQAGKARDTKRRQKFRV